LPDGKLFESYPSRRLLREDGAGETPQALAPRRIPGPPAESEVYSGCELNNNENSLVKTKKELWQPTVPLTLF